jgi:glutathione S-transferase
MSATLPQSLKLSYFNIQGPAEKIRLALSIGKIPFEDKRIAMPGQSEEWKEMKPNMPFGKVPVLEIDGKEMVSQSDALLRYAGRLANANGVELYPQGGMAQLRTDEMISLVDEMQNSWAPRLYVGMSPKNFGYPDDESWKGSEEHKKATELARLRWIEDDLPVYLGHIKKQLANNGGKFICGENVTIADCYLVPLLNRLASGGIDYVDKECVARHGGAEITDYIERFMNIEEVKKWYAPKDV